MSIGVWEDGVDGWFCAASFWLAGWLASSWFDC